MKMIRTLVAVLLFCALAYPALAQTNGEGALVQGTVVNRSTINSSVTITTGNTFQQVLASNYQTSTQRQALTIENNNTTDNCWVFVGAGSPSKANSMLLLPGGSYARYWPFVPSDVIQATCATGGDTLYVETN